MSNSGGGGGSSSNAPLPVFPLTVYVNKRSLGSGMGDYQMKINVPLLSTSHHIIKTILNSKQIYEPKPYALYLTHLIHHYSNDKHSIHRKFIRQLDITEFPLLITDLSSAFKNPPYTLYLTKITPENNPNTFISSFHILRKQQCKALPLNTLQKRLADIDDDEANAIDDVYLIYDDQRYLVEEKIKEMEDKL